MKSIEEMKSSPRLLVVKEGFDGLMGYLPMGISETTSEEWARYITGEIDRDELLAVYEKYWDDYSKQE